MYTRLDIERRETVLRGKPFGDAGAYEKVIGMLHFTADPGHPLHRQITDLDRVTVLDTVEWTRGADQVVGANSYRSWTGSGALMLIDTDVATNLV